MTIQLRNWQNSCAIDSVLMIMLDGESSYYRDRILNIEPEINSHCITDSGITSVQIRDAMTETMNILENVVNPDSDQKCTTLRNVLNKCRPDVNPLTDSGYRMTSALTSYEQIAELYGLKMAEAWTTFPAVCGVEWMCTRNKPFGLDKFDKDVLVISNELQDADTNLVYGVTQWIGPTMIDEKYKLYGVVSNISDSHFVSRYIDRTGKWVLSDDLHNEKQTIEILPPLEDAFKWGNGVSNMFGPNEKPIIWFYKKVSNVPKKPQVIENTNNFTVDDLFMLVYPLLQEKDGRYRNAIMHQLTDSVFSLIPELKDGIIGHLRAYFNSSESTQHVAVLHELLMNVDGITTVNFYNKVLSPILFLANVVYSVRVDNRTMLRSSFALDVPKQTEELIKVYSSNVILAHSMIRSMQNTDNAEIARLREQTGIRSWFKIIRKPTHLVTQVRLPETGEWKSIPDIPDPIQTEDKKVEVPTLFIAIHAKQRIDTIQRATLIGLREMISAIENTISNFGSTPVTWSEEDVLIVLDGNGTISNELSENIKKFASRFQANNIQRSIIVIGNRVFLCCLNKQQSNWAYVFDMSDKSVILESTEQIIKKTLETVLTMLFPYSWIEVCFRNGTNRIAPLKHQLGMASILLFMMKHSANLYILDLYLNRKEDRLVDTVAKNSHVLGYSNISAHLIKPNIRMSSIAFKDDQSFWGDLIPCHVNVNVLTQLCQLNNKVCNIEQTIDQLLQNLLPNE